MTPIGEVDRVDGCASCGQRPWPGDRFCRSCGQATGADVGHEVVEVNLERPTPTSDQVKPHRLARRWLLLLSVGIAVAVAAGLVIRSTDDAESSRAAESEQTPNVENRFDALPESMQRADDPPERQAALNAFETERERTRRAIDQMYAQLSPTSELLILVGEDLYRWHPRESRLTASPVSASGAASARAWSPLGPAKLAPWRIENRARLFLERWDDESNKWSASGVGASLPISTVAMSTTHVATESGGLIRFWSQATEQPTADAVGRLLPSTGPGFLVSTCDPECGVRLIGPSGGSGLNAARLDATTYAPALGHPARISPDSTSVAFLGDDNLTIWGAAATASEGEPWVIAQLLLPSKAIDVAWLPNSSGLLVLTPTTILLLDIDSSGGPIVDLTVKTPDGTALQGGWSGFGLVG